MRKPVVIVAGPTASGKSGLAIEIAERFDGVVVNADSMQMYRELAILTARPGPDAFARAPHRLYGTLAAADPCSAGRWRGLALAEIAAAHATGKLPIVTGGTGLYLRTLVEGLAEIPAVPVAVRAAARADYDRLGAAGFHAALARRDPASASRVRPTDRQRLIRAWEVLEASGRSLADWQAGGDPAASNALRFAGILLTPPRDSLYVACEQRFDAMIAAGALDEVRALLALDLDPSLPVLKAVGVAELARHLTGGLSLSEAIALAKQATRRLAKRQMTWFRHQPLAAEILGVPLGAQLSESFKPRIFNFIRQFLLTEDALSV